jgi:hypothetical protein
MYVLKMENEAGKCGWLFPWLPAAFVLLGHWPGGGRSGCSACGFAVLFWGLMANRKEESEAG